MSATAKVALQASGIYERTKCGCCGMIACGISVVKWESKREPDCVRTVLHENTKNKTQSRFLQGHSSLSGSLKVSQGLSWSLKVSHGLSQGLSGSLKVSHAFSGSLRGFHTRFLKVSHRISRRFSGSLNEMTQGLSQRLSKKLYQGI